MDDDNDNDDDDDDDAGCFGQPPSSQPPFPSSFVLPVYNPPTTSISEEEDNEIEKDLTPAQKFLLGEITKQPLVVGERVAVAEKTRIFENLNKLFPKADVVMTQQSLLVELK